MLKRCAACGQIIPPANPFLREPKVTWDDGGDGRSQLSRNAPIKARIYEFIAAHPEGVTRTEVVDFVYAGDRNGGPAWANTISIHIGQMNKALSREGFRCRIISTMGHGALYTLRAL